jgi:hypothetical protein
MRSPTHGGWLNETRFLWGNKHHNFISHRAFGSRAIQYLLGMFYVVRQRSVEPKSLNSLENRASPIRLDGGAGFSRTRFASANSADLSLRMAPGVGISQ